MFRFTDRVSVPRISLNQASYLARAFAAPSVLVPSYVVQIMILERKPWSTNPADMFPPGSA